MKTFLEFISLVVLAILMTYVDYIMIQRIYEIVATWRSAS